MFCLYKLVGFVSRRCPPLVLILNRSPARLYISSYVRRNIQYITTSVYEQLLYFIRGRGGRFTAVLIPFVVGRKCCDASCKVLHLTFFANLNTSRGGHNRKALLCYQTVFGLVIEERVMRKPEFSLSSWAPISEPLWPSCLRSIRRRGTEWGWFDGTRCGHRQCYISGQCTGRMSRWPRLCLQDIGACDPSQSARSGR